MMPSCNQYLKDYKWFNKNAIRKNIIDVIGMKGNSLHSKHKHMDDYKVMGIESKASYADFCNGFCCQCEYTYIIAPIGVVPVDKIPKKIGLIEVDLKKYKIKHNQRFEFNGVFTTKQCGSRKKELFKDSETYRIYVTNMLKSIAYRSTVNDIFKKSEIEIKGL